MGETIDFVIPKNPKGCGSCRYRDTLVRNDNRCDVGSRTLHRLKKAKTTERQIPLWSPIQLIRTHPPDNPYGTQDFVVLPKGEKIRVFDIHPACPALVQVGKEPETVVTAHLVPENLVRGEIQEP